MPVFHSKIRAFKILPGECEFAQCQRRRSKYRTPSFFHPRIVQKVFHRVVIRILKIGQRSYSHKKVLMNDSIDVDFQNDYFRMKRREEGTTWETSTKVYKKRGWPSQIWKPNSYIGQQEYLYISSCGIKPESFLFIMLYLLGMLKFNVKLSNLRF